MELFDDWNDRKPVYTPARAAVAQEPPPPSLVDLPGAIRARLAAIRPAIVDVHCYKDVDYPWLRVTFDEIIDPRVALNVGSALAAEAGEHRVYFNSLQPRAVCFLLALPLRPPEQMRAASQYGVPVSEVARSWLSSQQTPTSQTVLADFLADSI